MREEYIVPETEIVRFESEDIITTSSPFSLDEWETDKI